MKIRILLFGVLLIITSVCIGSNKKVEFTDPLKPIIVNRTSSEFKIILNSNPTTGYSWFLKSYDPNLIIPVSRKFYPPTDKRLLGAPGYEKWIFRVKSLGFTVPQISSVSLIYTRPWEEQGAQVTNFKVVTRNDD